MVWGAGGAGSVERLERAKPETYDVLSVNVYTSVTAGNVRLLHANVTLHIASEE
jgi:hypothetical protein